MGVSAILVTSAGWTQPGESWRKQLTQLPGAAGSQVALRVERPDGSVLIDWDSQRLQLPASTLKVATAVGLTERQGALDATLQTRIQVVTQGGQSRLRVLGQFDPELTGSDLEALVYQAAARLPAGKPVGVELGPPDSEPYASGWSWDDLSSSFAPPISSLVFDRSLVPLRLRSDASGTRFQVAGPAWFSPGAMTFLPGSSAQPELSVRVWPGWSGYVVEGRLAPNSEETLTVPQLRPEVATAQLVRLALQSRGFTSQLVDPAPEQPAAWEVSHSSRPVRDMLTQGLADSDNLVLECLYRRFDRPTPSCWKGQTLRAVDGSGLSRYNLVSSRQLLQALQSKPEVVDMLPLAGRSGTMRRRLLGTPLEGKVHAKTGTLSGVSGLVGEFPGGDGKPLRFCLLIQGFVGSSAPIKQAEDQLLVELSKAL